MPTSYLTPGIYIEEVERGPKPIQAVGTSTCGFVGEAPDPQAHVNEARAIDSWSQFVREYVGEGGASTPLSHGVFGFFANGGRRCYVVNVGKGGALTGDGRRRSGIHLLEEIDEVAMVAAPGYTDPVSYDALLTHCEKLKDRIAIMDAPAEVPKIEALTVVGTAAGSRRRRRGGEGEEGGEGEGGEAGESGGLRPRVSDRGFGAFYFPWLTMRDPLAPDQLVDVPPSGHIAGVYAQTDGVEGVHHPPANKAIRGAVGLPIRITDEEQGNLNSNGVNCIRFFTREGIRIWGARTVADPSSEWRYVNVRRLFSMVEKSIAQSTRWVVFKPNGEPLWKDITRDVSAFLRLLWRAGALMGRTPEEAFFVKCDAETNPPEVIEAGQVVTLIGIAPVKPAEFIIFRIGQHAGGVELQS